MRSYLLSAALVLGAAVSTHASTIGLSDIDGVMGSEWSQVNGFVIRTDSAGNQTARFLRFGGDGYIYLGYLYLGGGVKNFEGVNAYLYGTGAGTTYGDGNDVVIEGGNYRWAFGGPSGAITPFVSMNTVVGANHRSDAAGDVHQGYIAGANFAEFAVSTTLLGTQNTYRFGGQTWQYDFLFNNVAANASLFANPVPLPAASMAGGVMLTSLLARRRRA